MCLCVLWWLTGFVWCVCAFCSVKVVRSKKTKLNSTTVDMARRGGWDTKYIHSLNARKALQQDRQRLLDVRTLGLVFPSLALLCPSLSLCLRFSVFCCSLLRLFRSLSFFLCITASSVPSATSLSSALHCVALWLQKGYVYRENCTDPEDPTDENLTESKFKDEVDRNKMRSEKLSRHAQCVTCVCLSLCLFINDCSLCLSACVSLPLSLSFFRCVCAFMCSRDKSDEKFRRWKAVKDMVSAAIDCINALPLASVLSPEEPVRTFPVTSFLLARLRPSVPSHCGFPPLTEQPTSPQPPRKSCGSVSAVH